MDDRTWLAGAIELNCEALLRIATELFAILRLPAGGMTDSLPAALYFRVLRILRPAESAVRRLVVLEAIGLEVEPAKSRNDAAGSPARAKPKTSTGRKPAAREPAFQIFDPFKPLPDDPWITGDGETGQSAFPVRFSFRPDAPRDARRLGRRIRALIGALDDLPAQARRLARWRLTRRRPRRFSSLRPGFPPGYRKARPSHKVDEILRESERLLAWAHSPPERR